jgi:hypothetical protein
MATEKEEQEIKYVIIEKFKKGGYNKPLPGTKPPPPPPPPSKKKS